MEFSNEEVETALLAALLRKNEMLYELDLSAEHFAVYGYDYIFDKFCRLYAEKQKFTVADFHENEPSQRLLRELADGMYFADPLTMRGYATVLKDLHRKRQIADAIQTAQTMLPHQSPADVIAALNAALTDNLDTHALKTAEQVFEEIVADLELPAKKYPTGLKMLDAAMGGGFYEGFTYGLAGEEKAGKTTFAHTISHNMSEAGCKHLYIALEMGSKQIEQRNLARKMQVNSLQFLNGAVGVKDKIHGLAPNQNTIYLDAPGADLQTILMQAMVAKLKHGVTGFIVDYWQLVEGEANTEERHLRNVAQSIANFARKQKLWCLLLAQRNAQGTLFGGGGLKKACDQLYYIERVDGIEDARWLNQDASRYTPRIHVGSDMDPAFILNTKIGPFITTAGVRA